jgi:hypothetical protein
MCPPQGLRRHRPQQRKRNKERLKKEKHHGPERKTRRGWSRCQRKKHRRDRRVGPCGSTRDHRHHRLRDVVDRSNAGRQLGGRRGRSTGGFRQTRKLCGHRWGTTFRIDELLPGNARFTHRTETIDYCIQLSGEVDCELESGEVVHLKAGDVFINRGGLHTWVNNGSVPAVGAAVMVDAKPVEVNGNELRTVYPNQQTAAKQ